MARSAPRSCSSPGSQPRLHAGHQVGRADSQVGDAVLGRQLPQPVRLGVAGAAVVEHDRQPGQQAAGQVVPHHPAGRGVPGEDVARPQILVERERLEVLEDDAAVPVHDRLGQPGGPRGVDDPERVRERHLLEVRLVLVALGAEIVPLRDPRRRLPRLADQVHQHDGGRSGQLRQHLVAQLRPGVLLAVVGVAVAGDQHLRLDLGEPVDHAARAEVRRARRPDRAQARGGEQADDGLGHVRQQRGHPVTASDPEDAQAPGDPGHLGGEFAVGEAPGPAPFGIKDYGGAGRVGPRGPQRVTGVVEG